jgi:hypothetical protein
MKDKGTNMIEYLGGAAVNWTKCLSNPEQWAVNSEFNLENLDSNYIKI